MSRLGVCLAGVCLSLIVVGVVSQTLSRHLIQVIPIIIVLTASLSGRKWVVFAASPLFIFWLLIMVFIWLYLLKIAAITRGHFTIPEIVLTIVIGIFCIYGMVLSLARVSLSVGTAILWSVWNLVIGFILIFFFNTLSHSLPGYRRNLELSLAMLIGLVVTLTAYFAGRSAPVFHGRPILAGVVTIALQAGAVAISYL